MAKNTLSIAMIVKNEAHHLPRCLEHAHLFADEVVIVDTGSTDTTKEVAKKFTSKIFDFVWCDDFAKARNASLEKCTQNFVMWLDADDIITKDNALKIKKLLGNPVDWDVIYLKYVCNVDANGNPTNILRKERIFRNKLGIKYVYPIHEMLKWPTTPLRFHMNDEEIMIYHRQTKDHQNLHPHKDSASRNIKILEKALQSQEYKDSNRLWGSLGDEYRHLGQPKNAVPSYIRALQCKDEQDPHVLSKQLFELATQFFALKQWDQALDALGQSMRLYPLWREPFFEAGKTYFEQQRFAESLQMFLICATIPRPVQKSIEDENIYSGYLYYDYLSLAYDRLGQWDKALESIRQALAFLPNDERLKKHEAVYLEQLKKLTPPTPS